MTKSKPLIFWITGLILALGVLLRTVAFSYVDSFEDDECRLILAFIDKSWLQMFLPLTEAQSAPPLFIIFERIIGTIFGFNERILKLIPYFSSVISIFVFHKICIKILPKFYPLADLLFVLNFKLILFSTIVKQYSSDVLVCALCLLFLPDINICNLNKKQLVVLGLVLIILPIISLPSLFFISAFILLNLIKFRGESLKRLSPLIILFAAFLGIYYFFNLAPSKILLDKHFPGYWDMGFINLKHPLTCLVANFKYLFQPNWLTLPELILSATGVWFFAKEKTNYAKFILITLVIMFLASLLHLYPFYNRVSIYSLVILVPLFIKPFEEINIKGAAFVFLTICLISGFAGYLQYFDKYFQEQTYIIYSPKIMLKTLISNFNPETDIIICNEASASSYLFYSSIMNFNSENVYKLPNHKNNTELKDYLNSLDKNYRYWFYIVKDFNQDSVMPTISRWAENKNAIIKAEERHSHLLLIK